MEGLTERPTLPTFSETLGVWGRVALQSFGGPAGQIAVMHRILVEEKRWISESRFLHALNYCMLLPGPEAQQLATYVGWLMHGTRGGLLSGGLFVLPGFVSILVLSILYAGFQEVGAVDALFWGLKAAVLAVVVEAVVRIGRRVLRNPVMIGVAAAAFVAIFLFEVPFPLIVLGAGLLGVVGERLRPASFLVIEPPKGRGEERPALLDAILESGVPRHLQPGLGRTIRTALTWLLIWLGPLGLMAAILGPDHVFVQVGAFFSKAAVVTFGGAYAVLAYIAQQAVEVHGWLRPGEMLDGLGMAETTPGPLIQVVQFVGFLATWRQPGSLSPLLSGILGSVLVMWVTFAPCFLWIFVGAPYIEWLRGNRRLTAALSTITAAVVGVILNLAAWFSLHVLFARVDEVEGPLGLRLLVPDWGTLDPAALLIAIGAAVALLRFHVGMLPTLAGAALLGLAWRLGLMGLLLGSAEAAPPSISTWQARLDAGHLALLEASLAEELERSYDPVVLSNAVALSRWGPNSRIDPLGLRGLPREPRPAPGRNGLMVEISTGPWNNGAWEARVGRWTLIPCCDEGSEIHPPRIEDNVLVIRGRDYPIFCPDAKEVAEVRLLLTSETTATGEVCGEKAQFRIWPGRHQRRQAWSAEKADEILAGLLAEIPGLVRVADGYHYLGVPLERCEAMAMSCDPAQLVAACRRGPDHLRVFGRVGGVVRSWKSEAGMRCAFHPIVGVAGPPGEPAPTPRP